VYYPVIAASRSSKWTDQEQSVHTTTMSMRHERAKKSRNAHDVCASWAWHDARCRLSWVATAIALAERDEIDVLDWPTARREARYTSRRVICICHYRLPKASHSFVGPDRAGGHGEPGRTASEPSGSARDALYNLASYEACIV